MRISSFLAATLTVMAFTSADARTRSVAHPVPPTNVRSIMFYEFAAVTVRPGGSHQFTLKEWLGAGPFNFRPISGVDVNWTIEPYGARSTIDANGLLTVAPNEYAGSILTVYANLNRGQRIMSQTVYVYSPGHDPFLDGGVWRQTAEIPCDGSADRPVTDGIRELRFDITGHYFVTWWPFELYHDYWGRYAFDRTRNKMMFGVLSGNYIPDDVRGDGAFEIVPLGEPQPTSWNTRLQRSQLRLTSIYLGTPRNLVLPDSAKPCGMVFEGTVELPQ